MRTSTATLVLTLLAFTIGPDRGAAQDTYPPTVLGEQTISSSIAQAVSGVCPVDLMSNSACGRTAPRVWGSAEYMLSFRKARRVGALVTTSPTGTVQAEAGVLGLGTTSTLYGGNGVEDNPESGIRGELGVWLDQGARFGVGGTFMSVLDESVGYSAASDGSTILARPFYNTLLGQEASQLVAFPGLMSGQLSVQSDNQITSTEGFLRQQIGVWPTASPLLCLADGLAMRFRSLFRLPGTQVVSIQEFNTPPGTPMTRVDFLAGYQFSRIDDSLSIANTMVSLDPAYLGQIGTTLDAFDRFDVRNDFHGGTLGLKSVTSQGRWALSLLGKVALGNMNQTATVAGQTVVTVPGGPSATFGNGLLTQASNMGRYERDCFAVIPEARIMVHYDLTPNINVGVGYHFIYWNNVALAGDLIDRRVDVSQTNADPSFAFNDQDFFVHSATFQLQMSF